MGYGLLWVMGYEGGAKIGINACYASDSRPRKHSQNFLEVGNYQILSCFKIFWPKTGGGVVADICQLRAACVPIAIYIWSGAAS